MAPYLNEVLSDPPSGGVEWVELYNPATVSASLVNWRIRDCTDTNSTMFSATINPISYQIIENKSNFFNNASSDCVRLFDSDNNLIDQHQLKPLTGNLSFSRQGDGTWCPANLSPNLTNFTCAQTISHQPISPTPTPIPFVFLDITQILPNPDDGDEWIKIYNPNDFEVNLTGWRILNQSNYSRPLNCSTIAPKSTCQATFSSGFFRNSDGLAVLLDTTKRSVDQISWVSTPKATSTRRPTSTKKPTLSKKITLPTCPNVDAAPCPQIATKSSSLQLQNGVPFKHYLSITLMFIGSLSIFWPLIFHDRKK